MSDAGPGGGRCRPCRYADGPVDELPEDPGTEPVVDDPTPSADESAALAESAESDPPVAPDIPADDVAEESADPAPSAAEPDGARSAAEPDPAPSAAESDPVEQPTDAVESTAVESKPEDAEEPTSQEPAVAEPAAAEQARPVPPPPGPDAAAAGGSETAGRRGPKRPRTAPPPAHIVDVDVLRVDGAEVEVRLADGRTGVIDRRDFPEAPSVGSTVPAAVLSRDDDRRGRVALSHRWARTELAWQRVEKARAEHTPLTGRVTKEVKGGVVVDLGLRAFLPTSLIGDIEIEVPAETADESVQSGGSEPAESAAAEPAAGGGAEGDTNAVDGDAVDTNAVAGDGQQVVGEPVVEAAPTAVEPERAPVTVTVADPRALVGREVEVLVTEADRARDRLVVSRRDLQRRQRRKEEKDRLSSIKVGSTATGKVVSVADYGAVVDLGGVRGLVHRSELSWARFGAPFDVVSVGDQVTVEVLDVNRSKKRVSLSIKRTMPDPYAGLEVGAIVPAVITRVVEYGAFAKLESGAEGLIHMSELSDVPGYRPDQLVIPGEDVMVKIMSVDTSKHRIGLSVRRVLVDD